MPVNSTMPVVERKRQSKLRERTLWTLQILAALFFLAAGLSKLAGVPYNVMVFEKVGFGQWFRYFTGVLEIAGALMLLMPRRIAVGGAVLSVVMIGAVIADRLALGGSGVPALVCLAVVGSITWFRRSTLLSSFQPASKP